MPLYDSARVYPGRTSEPAPKPRPLRRRIVSITLIVASVLGCLYVATASVRRIVVVNSTLSMAWNYTASDLLPAYGFKLDQPYPLTLGSQTAGSGGNMNVSTTFTLFRATATATDTTQPETAVKLGMQLGNKAYILEIPYKKFEFVLEDNAPQQAVFSVDDTVLESQKAYYDISSFWTFSSNHSPIMSGFNPGSTEAWKQGPAAILQDHAAKVVLTLTHAQYNAYLGSSKVPQSK